jgi:rhodanese-related sulfurtransferase
VGNGGEGFDIDPDSCRIDAHDALAWHRDGRAAFVDVRPVHGTGVPGATHLPVDEANMRVSELPTDVPVVAYCDDGADSARVVAFFRARGMEDTWWMAGGLPAWRDAGGAVTP